MMIRSTRNIRAGQARAASALVLAVFMLSGCGEGGLAGGLRSAGIGGTPDEFMVLPTKPLEMPADLGALPPPTPGAINRVDQRPEIDAVVALTGRPPVAGGAPAGVLITRFGPVDPQIRARLAAEDLQYRDENRGAVLERLANRDNSDVLIYEDMQLDASGEFDRLRARGVRVPAAPPLIQ